MIGNPNPMADVLTWGRTGIRGEQVVHRKVVVGSVPVVGLVGLAGSVIQDTVVDPVEMVELETAEVLVEMVEPAMRADPGERVGPAIVVDLAELVEQVELVELEELERVVAPVDLHARELVANPVVAHLAVNQVMANQVMAMVDRRRLIPRNLLAATAAIAGVGALGVVAALEPYLWRSGWVRSWWLVGGEN